MKHFMLDLETLGTGENAVVACIAYQEFVPETGELLKTNVLYPSIQSQMNAGRTIDESTLKWWLSQDKKAIESTFFKDGENIDNVIRSITDDMTGDDIVLWSNGMLFDINILKSFMGGKALSNINYGNFRDYRTIIKLFPEILKSEDGYTKLLTSHDALDDCRFQIYKLCAVLKLINKGK